jgi:hypothetical protein
MVTKQVDVDAVLRDVSKSGGDVIRGFRGKSEFVAVIQEGVNRGKLVAFAPSTRTLREFLNTNGFIMVMNEVYSLLQNCRIVIEPNEYSGRHLWVVGPLTEAATTEVIETAR